MPGVSVFLVNIIVNNRWNIYINGKDSLTAIERAAILREHPREHRRRVESGVDGPRQPPHLVSVQEKLCVFP